jgi:TolA-binding protein
MIDGMVVMHRRALTLSLSLLAGVGLGSIACLTPGQTASVGQQLDQIRQQAEQVRSAQQGIAASIGAIQTTERIPAAAPGNAAEAPRHHTAAGDGDSPVEAAGRGAGPEAAERSLPSSDEALFRQGYALYHRRDYQGAEQLLRRFLAADPDGSMADDALFWIAECRFARGLYRDAIFEYRDMIELHPGSHRVPRAWYMIALSYERLGETAAMNDNLAIVVERFPDSDVAPLARDRLGSL